MTTGPGARPFGSLLLGSQDQSRRVLRVRVQLLLTTIFVLTNLIAAGVTVVLSLFVLPAPPRASDTGAVLTYAVAAPAYALVAILVGVLIGTRIGLQTLRWVTRATQPTNAERRAALRLPLRLTVLQVGLWLGALILFTTLALILQPARTVSIAITLAITAVTSGAIAFLLTEFVLRPVSALALDDEQRREPPFLGVRRRQQIFWVLGTAMPVVGLMAEAIFVLAGAPVSRTRFAVLTLVVCGVVLLFGGAVNALSSRAVVAPITSVRRAMRAVEDGDYQRRVPVFDGTELGLLQTGFNRMADGLAEREKLRDLFGRHVGQDVARAAVESGVGLGGEARVVTVLFIDLVGSTEMASSTSPAEVVELLNRFFEVVVDEIEIRGGLVNKFVGDAVLAIFGAPTELEDHAGCALAAARAMSRRLAADLPEVRAGIGVYSGETVAGNVGTRSRLEYTVIGDAVNAASRLTELAKDVDPMLLTSWETVEAAGGDEATHWRRHDTVRLRGRGVDTELASCADLGAGVS